MYRFNFHSVPTVQLDRCGRRGALRQDGPTRDRDVRRWPGTRYK